MHPARIAPLLAALLLSTPLARRGGDSFFTFDPAKVQQGTLLHYVKSNRDGSQPWKLDVYTVAPTRIEVVKYHDGADDMVVVEADLDPLRGHMAHAFQHNLTAAEVRATMSAWVAADGHSVTVKLGNGQGFTLPVGATPFHFYGFDFLAVGWLLPHLSKPGKAFEVTFVDPNRTTGKDDVPFVVKIARFEPAGDETIAGVPCFKYKLAGPFFEGFAGTLWASKASGLLQRVESSLRTSIDWGKGFQARAAGSRKNRRLRVGKAQGSDPRPTRPGTVEGAPFQG